MAKTRLTKNELKKQKDELKRYTQYLPTLLLKKQQLQTEILKIHQEMEEQLGAQGACLDAIYYCPHHPDEQCTCRKPEPGMLRPGSGGCVDPSSLQCVPASAVACARMAIRSSYTAS